MKKKEKEEEIEEPWTFETMWDAVAGVGFDYKGFAEHFFEEARKAKLPDNLIWCIVGLCREAEALDEYYQQEFATNDDLKKVKHTIANHGHLPDGKAAEAL